MDTSGDSQTSETTSDRLGRLQPKLIQKLERIGVMRLNTRIDQVEAELTTGIPSLERVLLDNNGLFLERPPIIRPPSDEKTQAIIQAQELVYEALNKMRMYNQALLNLRADQDEDLPFTAALKEVDPDAPPPPPAPEVRKLFEEALVGRQPYASALRAGWQNVDMIYHDIKDAVTHADNFLVSL